VAVVNLTETEVALHELTGAPVLLQGRALARKGHVRSRAAAVTPGELTGTVQDGDRAHDVLVSLQFRPDGSLAAMHGHCGCGRAVPCPHAVALMLAGDSFDATATTVDATATTVAGTATTVAGAATTAAGAAGPQPPPSAWERQLAAALTPAPAGGRRMVRPAAPAESGQPGVALQFELTGEPAGVLALRPVVPGRSGAWVRSGVSWASLDYPDHYLRHVPLHHVQLLRELASLPASSPRAHWDRALSLGTISSRRVWDLLLEAQEAGLPLVLAGRHAEPVRVHAESVVARLDVGRASGELVVRPLLELATTTVPAEHTTLGDPAHGVVWASASQNGGLELARLSAPPNPVIARLAVSGPLRVPEADERRFLEGYLAQLAQHVEVVCRDDSVELPAAQPPVLRLQLTRSGKHHLALAWAWGYRLGDVSRTEPLARPPGAAAAGRDLPAEARTLQEVTALLAATVPGLLEASPEGTRPSERAELDGVGTARFLSAVVPALQDRPDAEVEFAAGASGPVYRETDVAPVIQFTAGESPGAASPTATPDWFDLAVTVTVDGHRVPFQQLFVALAQEQTHLLLDNGLWFSLDRPEFSQLAHLIAESRELLDAPPATVRLSRYHAGLWDDVERLGEITGSAAASAWRTAVRAVTTALDLPSHKVPIGLTATLRPYQQDGFSWLATLYGLRLGGVLADDMGLGKTVQALALMLHAREQGDTEQPFLVVAPTSVVSNWASEAARFAPGLRVAMISQMAARRGHDLATAIAGADLVVTSFTLFRLEFEEYRAQGWAGLFLDEAQNVKNHQSAGYRCARDLPAPVKFAITGTPMENHLMELWSLLSITAPGLFARPDRFSEYYRTPIERHQDGERLAQLRHRIRPLLLRRAKGQVARDLPDRQEQVIELELSTRHRSVYSRYLQRERQKVLGLLGDLSRNRFEIFRSLTLLRQASLDVSLVDPAHAGVPSTKLDALLDQLAGLAAEGHRVLVFSQFTRFLGKARDRLNAAGIQYCYLDGSTTNRAKVISSFRTGTAPVFLISLKAGGSGLNLTEADYVVLLDPWWNPATEAQAIDRAHRIGQTRKVMVYRMVAKDTIEEKVMALKARKAQLTASVLDGDDFAAGTLSADDIRGLLA
jgi:superfamily II DNA or RNA helicase